MSDELTKAEEWCAGRDMELEVVDGIRTAMVEIPADEVAELVVLVRWAIRACRECRPCRGRGIVSVHEREASEEDYLGPCPRCYEAREILKRLGG